MKRFAIFILVLVAIFVLSAVLAPVVYKLTDFKFERILNRLIMIFALITVAIFSKFRVDFKKYGLVWRSDSIRLFLNGFTSAFLFLVILLVIEAMSGVQAWTYKLTAGGLIKHIIKCLLTAFTVGIIEEFIFRGYIFEKVAGRFGIWVSLLVTNIFYGSIHFLRSSGVTAGDNPTVRTSFQVMIGFLKPFAHIGEVYPVLIGLFLFGLLLSLLYLRTGRNLLLPIGVHAAAVFYLKMDGKFVSYTGPSDSFLYGGGDIRGSVIAWMFVGIVICYLLVGIITKRSKIAAN